MPLHVQFSMCSFIIIGITVIEFHFFNLKDKKNKEKYEELQYNIAFLQIWESNILECVSCSHVQ